MSELKDDRGQTVTGAAAKAPSVLVAIVNYCTAELTIDCLQSLEPVVLAHPATRVVVADNASPDGSGERIAKAIESRGWAAWARVLLLAENGGFAFGNNAVIRSAGDQAPDYVWLLNSDTVVRPDALRHLLGFMEQSPQVGIAGSRLEYPDGTQQVSTFRFPSLLGEVLPVAPIGNWGQKRLSRWLVAEPASTEQRRCDWVSGASMIIRHETLQDVGLMDQSYFLYYEETDFCRRADNLGWQCWFVPESRVVHLIGASTGVTGATAGPPKRRPEYWFASRRRYFVQNHGRPYAVASEVVLAAAVGLRRMVDHLRRRPTHVPEKFARDLVRNSALFHR